MEGKDSITEEDPYFCGSCDGLICVAKELQMFIWNPTTGCCSEIPIPNASLYDRLLHGIGYNRSTGDYGVIFASHCTSDGAKDAVIELYTLKTRTWKRIETFDLDPESITSPLGISCNGDVYWLAMKESGCTVVCFDMVGERFKEILPLPYKDLDIWNVDFGICENCLCVFVHLNGSSFECVMLKMKGNEASYNEVFRYPLERFACSDSKAMCLTKNGEVVMDYGGWALCLYDPKLGKHNESFSLFHDTSSESMLFQESLVSPDP